MILQILANRIVWLTTHEVTGDGWTPPHGEMVLSSQSSQHGSPLEMPVPSVSSREDLYYISILCTLYC